MFLFFFYLFYFAWQNNTPRSDEPTGSPLDARSPVRKHWRTMGAKTIFLEDITNALWSFSTVQTRLMSSSLNWYPRLLEDLQQILHRLQREWMPSHYASGYVSLLFTSRSGWVTLGRMKIFSVHPDLPSGRVYKSLTKSVLKIFLPHITEIHKKKTYCTVNLKLT